MKSLKLKIAIFQTSKNITAFSQFFPFDSLLVFWHTSSLIMVFWKLKYFFIATLLLTQFPTFANDGENPHPLTPINGNNVLSSFSANWRIQEAQFLLLDILKVNRQMIRSQNIQIQKLLTVLYETNKKRHRHIAAKKLIEIMESSEYERMQQELINLAALAEDDEAPVSFRLAAIETLSENTLPNKWIDSSLNEAIHFTNDNQLVFAIKETQQKLKENYAKTGVKLSKLYSFSSPYVIKAVAFIWFGIYENNPHINNHLLQLLSSRHPNKQAIGLLVAEKLRTHYPKAISVNTSKKIDELRSNNHSSDSFFPSPTSYQSTQVNGRKVSKNSSRITLCETEFTPL